MKDNFDLKKFLTENNTLENSNPYLKEKMGEEMQEAKKVPLDFPIELNEQMDIYDEIANMEFGMDYDQLGPGEKEWVRDEIDNRSMNEAKKDEEDEEDVDIEVDADEDLEADIDLDNVEGEDTPDAGMPKVEGDEGEILSNLMKALDIAKSLDDEKLINQIGNTVTFLTRQYISTTK